MKINKLKEMDGNEIWTNAFSDRFDEEFRMSLVAMKDKLLALSQKYKVNFLQEAIDYFNDVKNLNKIDYERI